MRITQGTFSYLPDFSDAEIRAQIQFCLENGWPVSIEYTDDPHPRNTYWEMWGQPMFDLVDVEAVMQEFEGCRRTFPERYIRVNGYDRRLGRQTTALSFIARRPAAEPGFELERTEAADRRQQYTLRPYSTRRPSGQRYGA
jgi:ribulose-bisphosphate carboxylase small chain